MFDLDAEVYNRAFAIGYEAELSDLPYDPIADSDEVVSAGYRAGRLTALVDMIVVAVALFDAFESEI